MHVQRFGLGGTCVTSRRRYGLGGNTEASQRMYNKFRECICQVSYHLLFFQNIPHTRSYSSLTATDGGSKYGSNATPSTSSSENCSSFTFPVNFAAATAGLIYSSCNQNRGSRPLLMHALTDRCGRFDGGGFDGGGTTCGALFFVVPAILIVTALGAKRGLPRR